MPKFLKDNNWPFAPKSWPFFYGWFLLPFSTLGILMSVPGQTMGISVFTEYLIENLRLDRTELALAYMFGTLGSSFLLPKAGRLYDQIGARLLIVGASFFLGITLLFLSQVDRISHFIQAQTGLSNSICAFFTIFLGFMSVRFFGQGVLTMSSRNMLMEWFDQFRGRVNAINGIFVSLGFSLSPLFLNYLIEKFNWRGAWIFLAILVGGVFTIIALLFNRDKPENCGLSPDGFSHEKTKISSTQHDVIPAEVFRSYTFWIYNISLALYAMIITAVTFHIVKIFGMEGFNKETALSIFFYMAIFSTTTNIISSWLTDHVPLKYFLFPMLGGFMAGCFGLISLNQSWGFYLMAIGFGFGGGIWNALGSVTWAKLYGRKYLGTISGVYVSSLVFSSAIGPILFSLSLKYFNSFYPIEWFCFGIFGLVFLLAFGVSNPQKFE